MVDEVSNRFPGPPPNMDQFQPRPGIMPPNMRGPPPGGNFPPGMRPPGNFPPFPQHGFPNTPPFRPPFPNPGGPAPPTNQTLPKPPIFDKDGQVWLEACSADGKVYYFNAKTRETRWDKPGAETQADSKKSEEKESLKDEVKTDENQEDANEDVDGEEMKEDLVTVENDKEETTTEKSDQQQPSLETQSSQPLQPMQPPPQRPTFPPPQGMQTPRMPPPFGMPPMMRHPPGMPPAFPGFPPRFPSQGMAPGMAPPRFPPFPGFRLPPPDFAPKTIGEWTEHRLPDGRLYYYNNKSKESKWDKPAEFQVNKQENTENNTDSPTTVSVKKEEEKKPVEVKAEPVDKQQKPIASRPIIGTGWHLVWTGVGKVFFFNPTTKLSIWERPKELENNVNVDEILTQGPNPSKVEEPSPSSDVDMEKEKVSEFNAPQKRIEKEPVESEPVIKKKKIAVETTDYIQSLPIMVVDEKKKAEEDERRHHKKIMKEAEVKKAIIPLDERMIMFTNLLREKEVSAFSTWEKELHKILFDPRYLLLTMKERKHCYEKYVKVRAVEERKERTQKIKEKKEDFKKLLDEVISSVKISFSDFASKNSKDTRYKAIEKMREREQLFNEFMTDFRKHERERLKVREEKLRKHFSELLSELNNVTEESDWKKVKLSIQSDRRYELVGSSSKREQFFYDYLKQLTVKNTESESPIKEENDENAKEEIENEKERHPSPPPGQEAEVNLTLNKSERVEASIRKREEEVRAQKEVLEKDRQKERGLHLHEKAVQHFRALLADMVKDTQFSWKETRRSLRKDPRWSALEILDKSEKETLFNDHTKDIKDKRKKSFRTLLEDADVSLDAHWREVRRQIKDDPRYTKFGTSELREEEFETYLREKLTIARSDFRELLRETKLITYKSRDLIHDTNHLKDITEVLKKDKRFHVMSSLSNERDRLINAHVDELYKRGPPPPPTATNPSARYKKD